MRLRLVRDAAQFLECATRALAIGIRRFAGKRANQQLERGGTFGAVPGGKPAQVTLGQFGRATAIAAIEGDLRAPEQRNRMAAAALEQRQRLIEAPLPAAKL